MQHAMTACHNALKMSQMVFEPGADVHHYVDYRLWYSRPMLQAAAGLSDMLQYSCLSDAVTG
jgi:hypothetical protein